MPKVGNKHYPYTKAGVKAAKNEASKTGQDMKVSDARNRGNVSMGYSGGGGVKVMPPGTAGQRPKDPFDTSGREYQKGGITEIGDYSEGRWNDLLPDAISPSNPSVYGQPRIPIEPIPDDLIQGGGPRENPRTPIQPAGDELAGGGPDDEMTDFDEHSHMYATGGKTKAGGEEVDYGHWEPLKQRLSKDKKKNAKGGKTKAGGEEVDYDWSKPSEWLKDWRAHEEGGQVRPHKGDKDPRTGPTYATGGKTGAHGFDLLDPNSDYAKAMRKHIGSGGSFGNKKGGKVKKRK